MKKDISKIHYPEFPSLEGTNIGKLSQTQYLSSVIRVHIKMVQSLFGQIPEFKAMSEGAKRTLTRKELLFVEIERKNDYNDNHASHKL